MESMAPNTVMWGRFPVGRHLGAGVITALFSAIANLAGVGGPAAATLALMDVVAAATNMGILTAPARKA
jgi:hypothetical protein